MIHYFYKNRLKPYHYISMILSLFILCSFLITSCASKSEQEDTVTIQNLKVCHLTNPLGLDEHTPTFSWQMSGSKRGLMQSAYQIKVAQNTDALQTDSLIWDSGKITDSSSVGIPYAGEALSPMTRYYYTVTVWDETDTPHAALENAWFETGLLKDGMSDAKWISAPAPQEASSNEEDYFYNISYETEVSGTTAGFIFGATKGRYGTLYLCEISHNDEQPFFRLKQMNGGSFTSSEETDITHCCENNGFFQVTLSVASDTLSVTVNETEIGSFAIEKTPIGSIGYYKSRGVSYAYFDNILATNQEGQILYQEDFSSSETIFAPYHISLDNGRLKAGSGLLLTKGNDSPAPLFRREFDLPDKPIESARLYMTALGSFSASVNGRPISEDYFSPGKLAFNKQLSYMTYDITDFLEKGKTNALGLTLLHGWYDRAVGYPEIWNPWGEKNALLGKLVIRYEDGTTEEIVTDESFLCCTDGPIRSDDIYHGEYYDANYEQPGYDTAGFSDEGWLSADVNAISSDYLTLPLVAKKNEPIVCIEELTPISVSEPVENVFVYDFGQNFAGTSRIHVTGQKGQTITLRYGEDINTENLKNKDDAVGTVWTENLLTADATDYYVLRGDTNGETFTPEYTFHGFRYLQITGIEEALPLTDVKGLVLSSDLVQTGSFNSSHELLNKYYENTVRSQRSNFLDNPTDCPQRDERHGWAGDAQIFSQTASYHANTYSFYEKYLEELRLLQSEAGSFSDMAPRNFGTNPDGTGGGACNNCWGDAPIVITWNLYMQYGDIAIVEENYDALCKWIDVLVNTSENYIRSFGGYGDHLALENTPADVSDTAWCAHSAHLLSKMATALGKSEDAAYYDEIYQNYKKAWQNQYVLEDGSTTCYTQTSYALGLAFDLFPEELKEAATGHLMTLMEYSDYHIKTGFSGVGYLLPALSNTGHNDAAYRLLLQESYPSLLYPVTKGATTTWELWQGYTENEDGTYTLDGSFNHYAYGTPASFIYTDILGIQSDEQAPGYKHIILEPEHGNTLSYADGSYESIYGKISMRFEQTQNGYQYFVEIPANTTATLRLPTLSDNRTYLESGNTIDHAEGVTFIGTSGGKTVYELSSGSYCFSPAD